MNTRCGMKKKKNTTRWLAILIIVALTISSIVLPGSGVSARADNLDDKTASIENLDDKTVSVENLDEESANKENLTSDTDDKENLNNNITDNNNLDSKITDDENQKTRTVDDENLNSKNVDNVNQKTSTIDNENINNNTSDKSNLESKTDDNKKLNDNTSDKNNSESKTTDNNQNINTINNEKLDSNSADNNQNISTISNDNLDSESVNNSNSNKESTESYSISTLSEEGIEAYANEPPYEAENFFEASMTSTNGHYFAKGVFVNSEGDAYLLIEVEKNTNLKKILEVYIDGNKKEVSSVNRIETNTVTITLPDESQKTFTSENGFLVISIGKITNFNSGSFTLRVVTHADGGWGIDGTVTISLNYGISKEVNRTSATIGDEIIYTVTVNNAIDSDVPLFGVNVTDIVPDGLEVKKVNDSTDFSITNNIITLEENITLAIGETRTYTIIAVVSEDAVAGTITNKATMQGDFPTKSATADVTITAKNINIKKIISGNMAEMTKKFSFTATASKGTTYSKNYSFELGHNDVYNITSIPSDGTFTLSEVDSNGYVVNITVNDKEQTAVEGVYTINLGDYEDNNLDIVVTNKKNITIDTGVLLDSLPYIAILGVVIIAGGIFFINKRKKENDI